MHRVPVLLLTPLVLGGAVSLERGQRIFEGQCAICHGAGGEGGSGPSLQRPRLRRAPDDGALKRVIRAGIGGTSMPATWLNEGELTDVAAYVRSLGVRPVAAAVRGDAGRGKALYASAKAGCARCHTIWAEGGVFGPDLTDVGARRSPGHLRESLTDPGAAVERGVVVVQAGGVSGVRVNEDTFSIQVRDVSGKVHSLWKADVPGLRKEMGKSMMPSYRGVFSDSELDDLAAFLATLDGEFRP